MESEKILVVDDDEDLLHLMTLALKRRGFQVEGVNGADPALDMMRKQGPYAVLLTDLMMPGKNGLELMREARQLDPVIEMIVITAVGSLETAISALRSDGAYDYLLKPLESMGQLSLAVERAAAHRRLKLEREVLRDRVQSEAERLQALIANTGDAILSADADGIVTIVNPAAARLLGRYDLVGSPALANLLAPLVSVISNWQTIGGQRPAVMEVPWSDGSVQMINLTPLADNEGKSQGWVLVARDITHLKQMDEIKTQILTEAANKIRVPLAQAVSALAELSMLAVNDQRATQTVYRLTKLWGRIQEWVDDLLAQVRINTGASVRLAEVDTAKLLQDLSTALEQGIIRERGLKLDTKFEAALPAVRADPELLRKALHDLTQRAALRCGSGGTVHFMAREHQEQVWIMVGDDGPAVGATELPHLFEKSAGKPGTGENTGLELAMVKTVMDRLGGQVWIGGPGAVGSSITLCLPASKPK